MKKFELKYYKVYKYLLSTLVTFLGFASCEPIMPVAYGTPNANFKINGKIVSTLNSQAIPDIKVTINEQVAYSSETGDYQMTINDFPTTQTFQISFKDVDGLENGEFQDRDTSITFTDPEFVNGDGWYEGEISQEFNINLDPLE